MYRKNIFLALILLLFGFAAIHAQMKPKVSTEVFSNSFVEDLTLADGVKPHKEIDAIYADFSKSYRTFDAELVASLYTEDSAYLSPGSQIRFGRDKILESFSRSFKSTKDKGRAMTISFRIHQRKVEKKLGYDVGVYTLNYYKDDKMLSEHKGKFVVVAVKGKDKKWRFQVDGYSDIKVEK